LDVLRDALMKKAMKQMEDDGTLEKVIEGCVTIRRILLPPVMKLSER
jgi:hypothetical protein